MMEIEVTVTLKDLDELTAEVQKMAEDVRAKIASGEIKAEPEIEPEPCDCPGCTPHLGPEIPGGRRIMPGPDWPGWRPEQRPLTRRAWWGGTPSPPGRLSRPGCSPAALSENRPSRRPPFARCRRAHVGT